MIAVAPGVQDLQCDPAAVRMHGVRDDPVRARRADLERAAAGTPQRSIHTGKAKAWPYSSAKCSEASLVAP